MKCRLTFCSHTHIIVSQQVIRVFIVKFKKIFKTFILVLNNYMS